MKHIKRLYPSGFLYFFLLCGCGVFTTPLWPQTAYGVENNSGPAAVKSVQVDIANIRIKPSVKSAIIAKLKKGDRVEILTRQGSWMAVKLPDDRLGWAHRNLFSKPQIYLADTVDEKMLTAIQSEIISSVEEKVAFRLNGDYPPETFVIDIEQPKIVCDFEGLLIGGDIGRVISVNGTLIEQIRVAYHEKPAAKVRVVVDLVPERKYKIEQTFYRQEHIFELTVQPEQ